MFRVALPCCPLDGSELADFTVDPLIGETLAGRYEILECIGEGGMGRVYRARHSEMPREFAVKVLFGDIAADRAMRTRFRHEAEIAATLNHPNIASVVDFGDSGGLLFLAMELVSGRTLHELASSEVLAGDRVTALIRQVAAGLDHAHRRGLIHRDLKADNVIVGVEPDDERGEVAKIVDFGIAISVSPDATRLTSDGLVVGTPSVMSPEQLLGGDLDPRSDLFSLGVVTYELLAGRPPFEGPPLEIAQRNLVSPPPPIAERAPDRAVDPRLEAIAVKLMAKKPADRFQTATELIRALDAPSEVELSIAPTIAVVAGGGTRRRWLAVLVAASLIAIAAVVFATKRQPESALDAERTTEPTPTAASAADAAPAIDVRPAAVDAAVPARDAAVPVEIDAAAEPRPRTRRRRRPRPRPRSTPEPPPEKEDLYESRY